MALTCSSKSFIRFKLKAICWRMLNKVCASAEVPAAAPTTSLLGETKELVEQVWSRLGVRGLSVLVTTTEGLVKVNLAANRWRRGGGVGGDSNSSTGDLAFAATVALTYDSYCCSAGDNFC